MIKYAELVQYIKDNHVNWNTDLFDVLRGFFEGYSGQYSPPHPPPPTPSYPPVQQPLIQEHREDFHHPDNGEYTAQDVLDLFST